MGDEAIAAADLNSSSAAAFAAAAALGGDHRSAPPDAWSATCAGREYELLCRFSLAYARCHGYVGAVVCVVGFVMNLLNTVIPSRRQLMCPTNAILISISAADMATIAVFAPYLVLFFVLRDDDVRTSRAAAQYTLAFAHIGLVSHTASTWLTVTLAAFRCVHVLVRHGSAYCTYRHVWPTVAVVAAASVLLAAPQYVYQHVEQSPPASGEWYVRQVRSNETAQLDGTLLDVELWCVAVLAKIGPCVVLAVLSALLIRAMASSRAALRKWKSGDSCGGGDQHRGKDRQAQRTTAMLVAVVAIFGVVESPQALLLFLSQLLGEKFFAGVYLRLGDLCDLLTIVNSSTNFVIYCAMCKQFRGVVRSLVLRAFAPSALVADEPAVDTVSTSRGPASLGGGGGSSGGNAGGGGDSRKRTA